jgi:hypothetical protein
MHFNVVCDFLNSFLKKSGIKRLHRDRFIRIRFELGKFGFSFHYFMIKV